MLHFAMGYNYFQLLLFVICFCSYFFHPISIPTPCLSWLCNMVSLRKADHLESLPKIKNGVLVVAVICLETIDAFYLFKGCSRVPLFPNYLIVISIMLEGASVAGVLIVVMIVDAFSLAVFTALYALVTVFGTIRVASLL